MSKIGFRTQNVETPGEPAEAVIKIVDFIIRYSQFIRRIREYLDIGKFKQAIRFGVILASSFSLPCATYCGGYGFVPFVGCIPVDHV